MKLPVAKKVIFVGFGLALAIMVATVMISSQGLIGFVRTVNWVHHTHKVLERLESVLSLLKDAETGQRGYIITGDDRYLEPYHAAVREIDRRIGELRELTSDNPAQQQRLNSIEPLVASKLSELNETISLRKSRGFKATAQVVLTDRGKQIMDSIRGVIAGMRDEEDGLLKLRYEKSKASARNTIIKILIGNIASFILLFLVFYFLNSEISARKQMERELQKSHQKLEQRVKERTSALSKANEALETEIAERKEMEEDILRFRKLESLGIFAGGIAHDFNNLLAGILGNIGLAKMRFSPGDATYARLAEAEKACLRAKDLTQQLITFSKGGATVRKALSVAGLIRDAAGSAVAGSNCTCEFSIQGDLLPVEADGKQLYQVIRNIVANAVEAMPGGGVIAISAGNTEGGAEEDPPLGSCRHIQVSIHDDGAGIPEENLPKIFDPYFSTKGMGSQKGTGLGLALCQSIIKSHGGLIDVESGEKAGTTFRIYLPAGAAESTGPTCFQTEGAWKF
ncbi:MAG TPA: CHASE3 domain-containing protein [Dissulfurispiraceae bacterium]